MQPDARPKLSSNVILRHDAGRNRWVLLAPERVLTPDAVAVDVLKLCDGERSITDIAGELAREYRAPIERVAADITVLLASLSEKGVIVL